MWNSSALAVFLYAVFLFATIFLIRVFQRQIKFLLTLIFNCILGCGAILAINTFAAGWGIQLALNAVTAALCAFLGIWAPVFLVAFNLFF